MDDPDTEIPPAEVDRRLAEGDDLFVLDVRTEAAYEDRHVDGSTNLPIYEDLLRDDYSSLEAHLDDLPDEREIATVCVAGVTSARAAAFLRDRGYDARSVTGGMNEWDSEDRQ